MPTVPGVTRHTLDGIRTAPGPDPPDSSRCLIKGVSHAGSSRTPLRPARRTQTIWPYWHVPALSGLLPPSPAPPGSGCPQLHGPAATGSAAKVSHLHSNHSASRRTHDARHTAATVLLILGVPERVVMQIMGWSSTAMAARYQHVTASIRRDVAKQVGGLIWEVAKEKDPKKPKPKGKKKARPEAPPES